MLPRKFCQTLCLLVSANVHGRICLHDARSRICPEPQSTQTMKELNPLLHSQLRLAVMSILMNVDEADFVYLREETESTAGNLSVQIEKLSSAGYINVEKGFLGRKPRTVCRVTEKGRKAFEEYVDALKSYINLQ